MGQSSNPKYQIKIVKAGIGDPLLAVSFEFTNTDGTYSIPNPDQPLDNLSFQVTVGYEGGANNGSEWVSTINFGALKSAGPYHCDIPFDNLSDFQMGDLVSVTVHAMTIANAKFASSGGNDWVNQLTYHNPAVLFADIDVAYGYFPS